MTIQVGHSLGCPTFFYALPMGSQQVNRSTSRCPIGRISPIRPMLTNAKVPPLFLFAPKFAPFVVYINHNIS